MNPSLTSQQISFFAQNGYLELEELFSPTECIKFLAEIQTTLQARANTSFQTRDLWRDSPVLKTLFLSKKLSTLATSLAGKNPLRLGCDHWFPPAYSLRHPTKLKDLFSFQGIFCALFIRFDSTSPAQPAKPAPIGLHPFPKTPGSVLIVQPNLLLNWPPIDTGLYLAVYCNTNALYIHNPNDPAGASLRPLGYGYGDPLRNDTHPLLHRS